MTESDSLRLTREAAPLRRQLLAVVRRSIINGEYEPGERLVERVLCDRYGVSRTVVREVLRQLEGEALVVVVPSRGPVVAKLSPADAMALYEAREVLEAAAARLFATRATALERRQLRERLAALPSAFSGNDLLTILDAKDDYYEVLLSGARNRVIWALLESVHARINLLRGISLRAEGRASQSFEELERLTDAAVGGDPNGAAAAATQHIRSAAAAAIGMLAGREPGADGKVSQGETSQAQTKREVEDITRDVGSSR